MQAASHPSTEVNEAMESGTLYLCFTAGASLWPIIQEPNVFRLFKATLDLREGLVRDLFVWDLKKNKYPPPVFKV